jgi:hypothetical protein
LADLLGTFSHPCPPVPRVGARRHVEGHDPTDPLVDHYLGYVYTRSSIDGSATSTRIRWRGRPLPPGRYSPYLLKGDLYVKIAGVAFTVER